MGLAKLVSDRALAALAETPIGNLAAKRIESLSVRNAALQAELDEAHRRARDQAIEISRLNRELRSLRKSNAAQEG